MNVPVCFCASVLAITLAAMPVAASAQAEPEQVSSVYSVTDKEGHTVGVYEFNHVVRPEGLFAGSKLFKGAKAATAKKRGSPILRSYMELMPDRSFSKYSRWATEGSNVREFKIFIYKSEIRVREAVGSKGKVAVVGPLQPVYLIEADLPHTAAVLVDRTVPERKVACINTSLGKIGEAVIRVVGVAGGASASAAADPRKDADVPATVPADPAPAPADPAVAPVDPAPAAQPASAPASAAAAVPATGDLYEFRIEGDCGVVNVWQDGLGNFVKFTNESNMFVPLVP